jgi:hypothetical protein
MSDNRRFLKAFGRMDAKGRIVPGMVVLRKTKPPRGRWIEIQTYECCDGLAVTATPEDDFPYSTYQLTLTCDTASTTTVVTGASTATDINELTADLNTSAGFLGVFSNDGTDITLLLKKSVVDSFCSAGAITLAIINP